ncbi:unnamed protein product, partial [Ectocarpus sp. 8 AP-2014]
ERLSGQRRGRAPHDAVPGTGLLVVRVRAIRGRTVVLCRGDSHRVRRRLGGADDLQVFDDDTRSSGWGDLRYTSAVADAVGAFPRGSGIFRGSLSGPQ